MQNFKRFLSILLCLTMVLSYVPAVFADDAGATYVKVTETPEDWSGTYLLVCEEYSCALNGSLSKLDATNNNVAVTITDNQIHADENPDVSLETMTVTIEAAEGGYVMKSASGMYMYTTGDKNSLVTSDALETAAEYPLTLSVTTEGVDIASSAGAHLRFNCAADQMRFRFYKSSTYTMQKAVALYKLSDTQTPAEPEPANTLVLGNNELYSAGGVSGEYTYVAQQSGTLYFTVRYYKSFGTDFGEGMLNMPSWSQLLINGEAITSFRQTLDVTEGDVIDFALTSDEGEYTLGLNLSYEGFYEEPEGSELNPVKLSVADCPTESVVIPAGSSVWYQLDDDFFYGDYCLTVAGDDAYVYCDNTDALAFNLTDFYYYAESGKVTFWVYESLIQIGNTGESEAVFTLDAYDFDYSMDMSKGDNTFWLPRNTNGMYLYWTAQEADDATIEITGENWLYYAGVMDDPDGELPGEAHWSVEGASNTATFPVEAGDLVCVYITTIDANGCNPGGTLNVSLTFASDATEEPSYVFLYEGTCGSDLTWGLTEDGILVISGTGKMTNYISSSRVPWVDYVDSIKEVIIENGVTSIGGYAFYWCRNLERITIADSVTSIGQYAFVDCNKLKSIAISANVTSIGEQAFNGCSSLTSLVIPDSITTIADYTFRNCVGLTSVTLPEGLTAIGSYAFAGCTSLPGLVIPESVTQIYSSAFEGCTSLTEIVIPENVPYINWGTFQNCTNLANVTIGSGVTEICHYAFYGCTSLTEIVIPSSVNCIYNYAFNGCENLVKVMFTGNAPTIEDSVFNEVIATAYYPSGNETWAADVLQNYGGTLTWVAYGGPNCDNGHSYEAVVTAPACTEDGYTTYTCSVCGDSYVGDYVWAQGCDPWTLVTAPTFEAPGEAFKSCSKCGVTETRVLEQKKLSVPITNLPASFSNALGMLAWFYDLDPYYMIKVTNEYFLQDFDYLDAICIPVADYEAVLHMYFAVDDAMLSRIRQCSSADGWSIFYYDEAAQTYTIRMYGGIGGSLPPTELVGYVQDGDTYEVYYAVIIYAYLQDVLPEGVDEWEYAEELGWPATIEYDGIVFESGPEGYAAVMGTENYGEKYTVKLGDYVVQILSCVEYTEEDLPDHLHMHSRAVVEPTCTDQGYAEYTCDCGDSYMAEYTDIVDHDYVDGYCRFCGKENTGILASGTCGENLTWTLTEDGVLTISGTGDMDNYDLDAPWYSEKDNIFTVVIEDGVTSIGSDAFAWCNIQEVLISDTVTSIGESAFSSCFSLSSVTIPASVVEIGSQAFYWCNGLTGIWVDANNPNYSSDASGVLFDKNKTKLIRAPGEISGAYIVPDSVTVIEDYTFSNCYHLTGVTISDSVTNIGAAFMFCDSLTEIEFRGDVPTMSDSAFFDVTATAYYPADNETWTADMLQNYGGTITWIALREVLDGDNSVVNTNNVKDLSIRADADFDTFTHVTVNGEPVDPSHYTVTEGSTIVTFHADYLSTLLVGEYEIVMHFHDGTQARTNLTVAELEPVGTISKGSWTMLLDSVIYLNYYPKLEGFAEDFDFGTRGGVIIWTGDEDALFAYQGAARELMQIGKENCQVIAGMYQNEEGQWYVQSNEIFAKNLGDTVYIRPYVEVNGEYVYGGVNYYSAASYCYDILNNAEEREDTRNVCAALLAYGAAAQVYFDYNTEELVTEIPSKWSNIDLSQYNLAYDEAYIDELPTTSNVDQHIKDLAATLTGTRVSITHKPDTLDLQGAIRLTVRYSMENASIDWTNVASAKVLFWNEDAMADLDALTAENANYIGDLVYDEAEDIYKAQSDHILAKNLGDVVYFSVRIEMNDGTVYRGGLNWYSPEAFVADSIASESGAIDVCKAIAVYSEMAKLRFNCTHENVVYRRDYCYYNELQYDLLEVCTDCGEEIARHISEMCDVVYAEESCTLTVSLEGENWIFCVTNLTTGISSDYRFDTKGDANSWTMDVNAGDEIVVCVWYQQMDGDTSTGSFGISYDWFTDGPPTG